MSPLRKLKIIMPRSDSLPYLEKIASVVGPASRVAYGPAHIYPMSAPAFAAQPMVVRELDPGAQLKLYVHIPFCNYACNFCFYAKKIGAALEVKERYVSALLTELAQIPQGTPLSELFVGGGTPTALPPELLDQVLSSVMSRLVPDSRQVHTVEATPESVSRPHLSVLKKNGVGRVSMGVQSLNEGVLSTVRRRHTCGDALAACDMIVSEGMVLNVDLIYGLPGYTEEMFFSDFAAVAEHGVHSVTVYNLRINQSTPVAATIRDDERLDLSRLMRWRTFIKETAESHGFTQTRWHTYKRQGGSAAIHERAPSSSDGGHGHQFGIGMSARSHLGDVIFRNHDRLESYMERVVSGNSPVEETIQLSEDDRKALHVARTLGDGRRLDGVRYEAFFGTRFTEEFSGLLEGLDDAGLVEISSGSVSLSEAGKLVHDLITEAFYPDKARKWLAGRQDALRRHAIAPAI